MHISTLIGLALLVATTACNPTPEATAAEPAKKTETVQAAPLSEVLAPYLVIQKALAADQTAGIADAAKKLAAAAQAAKMTEVTEAAVKIIGEDIEADRATFKAVSLPVVKAVMADEKLKAKYTVVFCSMAPGSWVQEGGDIRNPYYGAKMLACGEIKNPKAK